VTTTVAGLNAWEVETWLPPATADEPDWLSELRKRHLAAVDEYTRAISAVIDGGEAIEAANRAHRRAVRDAVAAGREPPKREHDPDVDSAVEQVATEDTQAARVELAVVSCEILNSIREPEHAAEFQAFFFAASAQLRFALGRGPAPDGLDEAERQRIARQTTAKEEDSLPDIDSDEGRRLSQLGENESSTTEVAHAA
jgi:hypothetical protein